MNRETAEKIGGFVILLSIVIISGGLYLDSEIVVACLAMIAGVILGALSYKIGSEIGLVMWEKYKKRKDGG